MPTFAVTYTYTDDSAGRDKYRAAHREYLNAQHGLRAGAAYADDGPAGALLIFVADDPAEVGAIIEGDPFFTNGLIAAHEVRTWTPALGTAAESLT